MSNKPNHQASRDDKLRFKQTCRFLHTACQRPSMNDNNNNNNSNNNNNDNDNNDNNDNDNDDNKNKNNDATERNNRMISNVFLFGARAWSNVPVRYLRIGNNMRFCNAYST